MISFIIIGRNEGWKLTKCLASVFETIDHNKLTSWEVIYVDSNSADDSIDRAKAFVKTKIFKITGFYNAAIARNIGVEESVGETLFFIDGDMEIRPDFLPLVYNEKDGLKHSFVSGQLKNFNYDAKSILINNTWQYKDVLKEDKYLTTTGGIFIIERILWELVGGMDTRFKRGQDLELALRLSKTGHKILRKKEIIAHHHTISHSHYTRMWRTVISGDIAYSNSFLIRKHLTNKYIYGQIFRNYYTLFSLLFITIIAVMTNNYFYFIGYFILIIIKSRKSLALNLIRNIELLAFYIFRDFSFLFFFFIPLQKIDNSSVQYKRIK